jgi:hypothetical protein
MSNALLIAAAVAALLTPFISLLLPVQRAVPARPASRTRRVR